MAEGPKAPPVACITVRIICRASGAGIGIAIALGWAAAMIAYYGWSIWYLQQPDVKKLFEEPLAVMELWRS